MKADEQYFADWECSVFGFGYGTGEMHILPALRGFLERCVGHPAAYDYRLMEAALGGSTAWFLINALCRAGIIEYGSSPRFGWLTPEGNRLGAFVLSKRADELIEIITGHTAGDFCYPDSCNCGPNGYEAGRVCQNPFWPHRISPPTMINEA